VNAKRAKLWASVDVVETDHALARAFADRVEALCEKVLGHCAPFSLLDPFKDIIIVREDMDPFMTSMLHFQGWMLGYTHRGIDVVEALRQLPKTTDGRFRVFLVVGGRVQAGLARLRMPHGDA